MTDTLQTESRAVGDAEVDAYDRDGVVILRALFRDWIELLREGVARNMAEPGPWAKHYREAGSDAEFFGDYCNWQRIGEYRRFLFESPAAEIAARLTRSATVRLFHEHVLVKEPGAGTATPWHQDQPYYCIDGHQVVSLWLALDDVPRETSIEYVAGSHRWNRRFRPERFNRQPLYDGGDYERLPDIEAHRDEFDIRGWDIEAGDAVAFHFMTIHGAPPNRSTSRSRRAFSSRWLGDDTRFAIRPGETSPPFPEVRLRHGDRPDHPSFPIIYPRQARA
jgi:ectoine hydroxylase-related dioxygenase (phytanoyl-CoA dioxygenase family)